MKLNLTKPLVIFDLETTGLDLVKDRIIQISYIKVYPDGHEERGNELVNPEKPIEPMITQGSREVFMAEDKWTIYTRDHRPAAHFEHTLAVHHGKADILSSFEEIEKLEAQRNQTL